MWESRTKQDLIIEVWEKLDCDSVGASEIEAIATAVEAQHGKAAVDSPMVIARTLADEGAELRHSEIMRLYIERSADRPYDAALRNILSLDSLAATLRSMRDLENLRRRYNSDGDRNGLRAVRDLAIEAKQTLKSRIEDISTNDADRSIAIELNEWLSHWLQTPQLFADWVEMRQRSTDFVDRFGVVATDK